MQENNKDTFTELTADELENSTVFSKPNTDCKPPKDTGAKLFLKTLVAIIIVAVLIVAIIFINSKFGTKNGSSYLSAASDVTSSDTTQYVEKAQVEDIRKVTLSNSNGTYVFTPEDGEEDDTLLWYVDGIAKKYCNTSNTELTVTNCAKIAYLSADKKIDGRKYGFDNPAAKVTVKHKDGEYSFVVTEPFENSNMTGAYIKFDNDETVYLISQSVSEDYIYDTTRYISTNVASAFTENDNNSDYFTGGELSSFDYFEYSGNMAPDGTVRIVPYGRNNSTQLYKMTKPYNLNINANNITDILSILKTNIEASDIYYYSKNGIDAKTLKEYGLDSPDAEITYKLGDEIFTIKLKLSNKDDFYYSMLFNDDPVIYKVSSKTFPFLEYTVAELATETLVIENIDGLESVNLEYKGENYKFCISTVTTTTSDGEEDSDIAVKYNKKTIDSDNFRNFYYYMLKIGPYVTDNSLMNTRPDNITEYFTITFTPQESLEDPPLVLTVYKTENKKRYYLELNGNPIGLCGTEYPDMVTDNIENLLTGVTLKEIS